MPSGQSNLEEDVSDEPLFVEAPPKPPSTPRDYVAEHSASLAKAASLEAERRREPAPRPNGGAWISLGWTLLGAGLVALGVGILLPTFSAPDYIERIRNPDALGPLNPWKWPLIWGGAALLNLGVLLLVTGQVIRAIFHLPGREVTRGELDW